MFLNRHSNDIQTGIWGGFQFMRFNNTTRGAARLCLAIKLARRELAIIDEPDYKYNLY